MSLRERAQQHAQQRRGKGISGGGTAVIQDERLERGSGGAIGATIQWFDTPAYGILDDQIVDVNGVMDLRGFSLAYLCADPETGDNAPVPYDELRFFRTATRAALKQLLEAERRNQR